MSLDAARAVADAVLYEGYLLYPYRATSGKNQVRWQFGVLGPVGAEAAATGEAAGLSMQCLLRAPDEADPESKVSIHVRFLQVQHRWTQELVPGAEGEFIDRPELTVGSQRWLAWDEAVEVERVVELSLSELHGGVSTALGAPAGKEIEELTDGAGFTTGRLVRERWPVTAELHAEVERVEGLYRLTIRLDNTVDAGGLGKDDVIRRSLVGTHLLIEASGQGVGFVSVFDPPVDARSAADQCQQRRCWPVLAGREGDDSLVLGSPIILYDHPEIAAESVGALFDSTEIDEILTLRVLTMTDDEKSEARATDARAAQIIDRCEQMSASDLQRLHGVLRDPFGAAPDPFSTTDPLGTLEPFGATADPFATAKPWWDPESEAAVDPQADSVLVEGVHVTRDTLVRIHPNRRADAQDLFFAGQVARVTAIHRDVDGACHVAVVLVDDPAADLHEWYGRYLYFAPDEVEPLSAQPQPERREESRP